MDHDPSAEEDGPDNIDLCGDIEVGNLKGGCMRLRARARMLAWLRVYKQGDVSFLKLNPNSIGRHVYAVHRKCTHEGAPEGLRHNRYRGGH